MVDPQPIAFDPEDLKAIPNAPKPEDMFKGMDLSNIPDAPGPGAPSAADLANPELLSPGAGGLDEMNAQAVDTQNYTGLRPVWKSAHPPSFRLLRANAPQALQDVWNTTSMEPVTGIPESPLRPDIRQEITWLGLGPRESLLPNEAGTLENLPIGVGKGIAGAAGFIASNLWGLGRAEGEQYGPQSSKADVYNSVTKAISDALGVSGFEEPPDFASAILRGAGESLPQLLLLGPIGGVAGVATEATLGGKFAEAAPFLYAKAFPIVRDSLTFGAYGALQPQDQGSQAGIGAAVGAAIGTLGAYGRVSRMIGGAGIGVGQEYLSNPNATAQDYARSATLMGVFAGLAEAHGLTLDETISGTLWDWAQKKYGGTEAVNRALTMNGVGPVLNEFAEDITGPVQPQKPATFEEAEQQRFPAFVRQNLDRIEEGTKALPTVEKIGPEGLKVLADDLGFKSVDEMREQVPAFSQVLENSRFAELTGEQKISEIGTLLDYAKKAGPEAMRQLSEDYGYKDADEMMAAYAEGIKADLPTDDPRVVYRTGGKAGPAEQMLASPAGSNDWGQIGPEAAGIIGRTSAPIRLQFGTNEGPNKYGWLHIDAQHGEDIRKAGYPDVNSFVHDVVDNFTEIKRGAGESLVLVKQNGKSKIAFVELQPSQEGDFYTVKSGFPVRERYLDKYESLWSGSATPQPTPGASPPRPESSQVAGEKPDSAGDQSDNRIIGPDEDTGKSTKAPDAPDPKDKIIEFRNVFPDTTETVKAVADRIANMGRADLWRGLFRRIQDALTLDPVPQMARVANFLADKAVEHASSRIAAPKMVDNLLSSVFPDSYKNPEEMNKTMDILVKDNILAGWDQFKERALKAYDRGQMEAGDRWTEAADLIAKRHDLDKYDADVKAARNDPTISGNIDRWVKYVSGPQGTLTRLYNEVKGLDPDMEQPARGRYFGARINLTTVERAAKIAEIAGDITKDYEPPQVGAQYRNLNVQGYKNPEVGPDPYDRAAAFTGEYSTDVRLNLLGALGPRLNEATKLRLYRALIQSGAALPWDAENPGTIQGIPSTKLSMKIPETPVFEDGSKGQTQYKDRDMYVREDIAGEIRRVVATDMRISTNPIAHALTMLQVAQIVDLAAHLQNIMSVVTRAQGAGDAWTDVVRKMPVFGRVDALGRIFTAMREVMSDSPAIRDEIAQMSEKGLIRPEHPQDWFQKLTHGQELIHGIDTGARILMNRFFDNLVERGLAVDSDANRRGYINQVGMYNRRLMGPITQVAIDSGMTPFLVAGRNFNTQGVRAITLNPGLEATSMGAALQMRATNAIGAVLTASVIPMILNTLTTGKPMGRPGTPIGAWDIGRDEDEKGAHRVIDLLAWLGARRGMRATGLDALVEGLRAGHTSDQISKDAGTQAIQTWAHPWIGPASGFAIRAAVGVAPDVRGKMEAEQYPGHNWKQVFENSRAAIKSQNAPLYALMRPAWQAAGLDQDDKTPYYSNFTGTFLKGATSLLAARDSYPPRSAAEQQVANILHEVHGFEPGELEHVQLKAQMKRLTREGKDIPQELQDRADEFGKGEEKSIGRAADTTTLHEGFSRLTKLDQMIDVLKVATPAERDDLQDIWIKKSNSILKNAAPAHVDQMQSQVDETEKLFD